MRPRLAILLASAIVLAILANFLEAQVTVRQAQFGAFLFSPAAQRFQLRIDGVAQWEMDQSGDWVAATDDTDDIGNIAGLRPRIIYLGTGIAVGTNPASAGSYRLANAGTVQARNGANTGNLSLLTTDAADTTIFASGTQLTITTTPGVNVPANSGWRVVCVSSTTGKIFFAKTVDAFGCQP